MARPFSHLLFLLDILGIFFLSLTELHLISQFTILPKNYLWLMFLVSIFFPPLKLSPLKRMIQMLKSDSEIIMAKTIHAVQ